MTDADGDNADLLAAVYDQLRGIARHRLAHEQTGHTLQATALVHEAWLKLNHRDSVMALDHDRFILAAAEAMRRILIDHARARGRIKRGGELRRAPTEVSDVASLAADADPDLILRLDDALRRLAVEDPQAAAIVELRFFTGLSVEETAACLKVSERTVKRDWQFARAWLFNVMG